MKIKNWKKTIDKETDGRRNIVYKGINAILDISYMPGYRFGTGIEIESDEGIISVHPFEKTLRDYKDAAIAFMKDNPIIKYPLIKSEGYRYTAEYI